MYGHSMPRDSAMSRRSVRAKTESEKSPLKKTNATRMYVGPLAEECQSIPSARSGGGGVIPQFFFFRSCKSTKGQKRERPDEIDLSRVDILRDGADADSEGYALPAGASEVPATQPKRHRRKRSEQGEVVARDRSVQRLHESDDAYSARLNSQRGTDRRGGSGQQRQPTPAFVSGRSRRGRAETADYDSGRNSVHWRCASAASATARCARIAFLVGLLRTVGHGVISLRNFVI